MRIALFSATFLASSLSFAATAIDGLYGSVFGGYAYLPDNISRLRLDHYFDRASFGNGFNAGVRFGFQSNPLRYEGEYTYLYANALSFRSRHFPLIPGSWTHHRHAQGSTSASLGMANIYYDFPEMVPCISPFLGVGLGYAWVQTTLTRRATLLFPRRHISESGSAFGYQGTAGFTFNFVESWALNLAYRYVGTTRVKDLGKVFQGHLASVGLVYRFNEYKYK
jgi:opacity protein-like surface antigen